MATTPDVISRPLTRRRLAQFGVAGAATAWLGSFERLGGLAAASSGGKPSLRRNSYTWLADRTFSVSADGATQALELVAVEDLPAAATVPSLRGLDDAFALQFRGDTAALTQGTHSFSHPELGSFSLFIVPIGPAETSQDYAAIIDRTVRIPGLDEDGAPNPVDPPRRRNDVSVRNRRKRRKRRRRGR